MAETGDRSLIVLAIHDALRRDLDHLQRATDNGAAGSPARHDAVLAGWMFYAQQLRHHQQSEDMDLWPRARAALTGRDAELALLDEMEAEHAVIDPAIAEVDQALRAIPHDDGRLAGAVDQFRTSLVTHLAHEEKAALPLLERTLDDSAWAQFSARQARKSGVRGITEFMPWLLHGADPQRAEQVVARLPPPIRFAVNRVALPRFAARTRW